jgi:RNA recognition motif-containing protein
MNNKLFVGNLNWDTSEEDLKAHFEQAGTVLEVKIILDRQGRSKGFGFVTMSTPEEAQNAIETLDQQELNQRNLNVNEAKPEQPRM